MMATGSTLGPWYMIEDTRRLESPALVIYYDRLLDNIRRLKKMVGDDSRIRPHVKTNKMPEVCRLLQQHYITRFKCATIAEAEMLAQINAEDVLLAYPLIGPDLERWLQLIQLLQFRNIFQVKGRLFFSKSSVQVGTDTDMAGITCQLTNMVHVLKQGLQPTVHGPGR